MKYELHSSSLYVPKNKFRFFFYDCVNLIMWIGYMKKEWTSLKQPLYTCQGFLIRAHLTLIPQCHLMYPQCLCSHHKLDFGVTRPNCVSSLYGGIFSSTKLQRCKTVRFKPCFHQLVLFSLSRYGMLFVAFLLTETGP